MFGGMFKKEEEEKKSRSSSKSSEKNAESRVDQNKAQANAQVVGIGGSAAVDILGGLKAPAG